MRLRVLAFSAALLLGPAYGQTAPADTGTTAMFTLSEKTEVPGKVLKPGTYTIVVVDRLSDRVILRIARDGKPETTFLGLPASGMPKSGASGPVALGSSAYARQALRGFAFPSGLKAEFVYPKAEAVELAKKNGSEIPAVDPASEGRPKLEKLSPGDLQEVTLWLLSPTMVGPQQGIEASRYRVPAQSSATEQASGRAPQPRTTASPTSATLATRMAPSNEVATGSTPPRPRAARRPAMVALPHTAGDLPLISLLGLLSLGGAGVLAVRRRKAAFGAARA